MLGCELSIQEIMPFDVFNSIHEKKTQKKENEQKMKIRTKSEEEKIGKKQRMKGKCNSFPLVFLSINSTNPKIFIHLISRTFKPTIQPMENPLDCLCARCI